MAVVWHAVESVNLLKPTYHEGNKELHMCLDGLMLPNLFKPLYNTANQEFHTSSGGSTLPKYNTAEETRTTG